MDISYQLSYLGYSDNEIKVYLSLLSSGWNYVSKLARDTWLERASLYYTLDQLQKKWLVSFLMKNKIQFYLAEKPERLLNLFKEKRNVAQMLLPSLKMLENTAGHKPNFTLHEWIEWVKSVLEEILQNKEILSYANLQNFLQFDKKLLYGFLKSLQKNQIGLHLILSFSQDIKNLLDEHNSEWKKKISYVFINSGEFPFQYDVFIWEKTVWIISFINKEIIAIKIDSKAYADSQRAIFNLAWLGATSFVI